MDDTGRTVEDGLGFLPELPATPRPPEAEAAKRQTTQSNTVPGTTTPGAGGDTAEANIILISHPQNKNIGRRFRLAPDRSLEIGRSPDAEVALPEVPSISRNHARLEYRDGVVILRDLHSTNGTAVNDRRIDGPTPLRSGDRFQIGAVHFKFLHERDVEHAYHNAIFELVIRDGLTGVFNKRKFDEEIDREFARARRYGRALSLVLADIDLFKAVNDRHGHLAGDFVLQQIASRMRDVLRAEQVLARVGGEEFAVLCPETDTAGAVEVAEKLRHGVAAAPFCPGKLRISVTCSFGVAERTEAMAAPPELLAAADRALYRSKSEGRNRISAE